MLGILFEHECFCADNATEVAEQLFNISNGNLTSDEVGVQTSLWLSGEARLCAEIQITD